MRRWLKKDGGTWREGVAIHRVSRYNERMNDKASVMQLRFAGEKQDALEEHEWKHL